MSAIEEPLTLRATTIPNRLWMSPMCQYSAGNDGLPTDWHLVHYGSRAVGGCGLIMVESTAIGPQHRTTAADLGIWNTEQVTAHRRLTDFIREAGAVPAAQLQCAGRKSSHMIPWKEEGQNSPVVPMDGGWTPLAPSPIPFGNLTAPPGMSLEEIDDVVEAFANATRLSHEAGYEIVEIHAGHGYLLHQFLSELANQRADEYGGSLENRMRLPLRVAAAVREAFPDERPVFVRITATDWIDGGITIDEATRFAQELAGLGIDLLDVTSGALVHGAPPPRRSGLNVSHSQALKNASGLPVAPVGQIEEQNHINEALDGAGVDAVIIGRALLRDPYFALRMSQTTPHSIWPYQYHRALQ